MIKKYDWVAIQQEYDNGLSQGDILRKYGMSPRSIVLATRRGVFSPRTKSEAAILWHAGREPLVHSESTKTKMRDLIKARYDQGWMPKAGRCKKYTHVSPIAGTVSVDGTWELAVAVWLDEQGWNWRRNTKRFSYIHTNGKQSWYTPDFWVEQLGGYLEVKGYETDLDRCKWSQFPESLVIWKQEELVARQIIRRGARKVNGADC